MGGFDFEFHSNNYNTCGKIIWQNSQKFAGVQKLVQPPFWPAATCKEVLGGFLLSKRFLTSYLHLSSHPQSCQNKAAVSCVPPKSYTARENHLQPRCKMLSWKQSLSYIQASILENLGAFHEIYIHTSRLLKLQRARYLTKFGHVWAYSDLRNRFLFTRHINVCIQQIFIKHCYMLGCVCYTCL